MSEAQPAPVESLVPPRFLFRVAVPLRGAPRLWTAQGAALGEEHRLPRLHPLDGREGFAELRAGWAPEGLAFWLEVRGKQKYPWCHERRVDASDGLQVFLDTRDTQNIHRAGRFCHRFVFLPSGGGRTRREPIGEQLLIHRARENALPVRPGVLQARAKLLSDGYQLHGLVPAAALTGWDPQEYSRLGFTYAVLDHELGEQTFTVGEPFPYQEDPSLWATLEMVA